MLAEFESGLVGVVAASALASRLRLVDALPDLEGDTLVAKMAVDAPAVYVAMGSSPVRDGYIKLRAGLACVARNSRGQLAARHGDGQVIGMLEIADAVMTLIDGAMLDVGGDRVGLAVTACDMLNSEALYRAGLYVAIVQVEVQASVAIGALIDPTTLADFKTFHADYDVEPLADGAEHDKWLAEPPDHTGSAPELSDTLNLQE